ncbi:MAG TPA: LLM class flavin-dependent oxidoreductase [Candidatus Sulfotelmatobacter sp.]|nr:LLM class flavin-dependent oxidoreductase [Candidatus Sulfotelmatobacter sp.]
MRFSNFLFPESRDPGHDGAVIDETLREAELSDALGVDVIWLAEHHFDGICAYVDPISFAAAVAARTTRAKIGFAVVQTSLHHPIRLAEQIALIDHISKGRLIVGLGRGTAYNIYDYQGYGIDPEEAQARFEEAEAVMVRAWTEDGFEHRGRFWQLKVPQLRPRPFTRPHPFLIRSASSEAGMVEIARHGRPFMMNVQSNAVTRQRLELYCRTLRETAGLDEAAVARTLDQCWVWRNVFVAATDEEAERVGVPAFVQMVEQRAAMRNRVYAEQGVRLRAEPADATPARADPGHALIRGAPATVAAALREIEALGVGGVIMAFRLGPLPHDVAAESLRLFMTEVAPQFRRRAAA